jgi:hypothetical protein
MFPKTGRGFPNGAERLTEDDYIAAVSAALKGELGMGTGAAKQIQRWTEVSDRTARNWLNGEAGPSGHHLMRLARESDAMLFSLLTMAGRPELTLAVDLHAVEVALAKASGAFEILRRQRSGGAR